MNLSSRILLIAFFMTLSFNAVAQNDETRLNSLLAEIDVSDIKHNIAQIANEAAGKLAYSKITDTAILPFRDASHHRTGLTEFIAVEFGKKLAFTQKVEVMATDQIAEVLPNQINLATMRWPQDCARVAGGLGVTSLVRGRTIADEEIIILKIEIYSVDKNSVIATYKTNLPRTADLSRLMELVVIEGGPTKPETPSPQPMRSGELPTSKPMPSPNISTPAVTTALEISVRGLADKLAARLAEAKQFKVGILEFLDLQGRVSQLGKFIAEDLTTVFFEQGKFSMIERGLLQQVMREHALTQTGIINITQAQEIGKLVGADAIITGSLSDLGNEIKANVRLIDVRGGAVLAVAGESIAKTENVAKLFNEILWSPAGVTAPPQ